MRASEKRARMVRVLVTSEQETTLKRAAKRAGVSLSAWLAGVALKAAR